MFFCVCFTETSDDRNVLWVTPLSRLHPAVWDHHWLGGVVLPAICWAAPAATSSTFTLPLWWNSPNYKRCWDRQHSEQIWFRFRWMQWNDQIWQNNYRRGFEHTISTCVMFCYDGEHKRCFDGREGNVGRSVPAQSCGCWLGLLFQVARSSAHNPDLSHAGTAKFTLTICQQPFHSKADLFGVYLLTSFDDCLRLVLISVAGLLPPAGSALQLIYSPDMNTWTMNHEPWTILPACGGRQREPTTFELLSSFSWSLGLPQTPEAAPLFFLKADLRL